MLLRVVLAFALVFAANFAFARQESAQQEKGKETDSPVKPEELLALIAQADKVAVYNYADVDNAKLLYSSANAKVISGLKAAMAVEPVLDEHGSGHCLCMAYPEIRLYRQRKELARISFVHGTFVNTTLWDHQARILDEEKLLRWFDARGIHGPRRESIDRRADAAADERWMKAMPASVRPLWPQIMRARPLDSGIIFVPPGAPHGSKAPAAGEPAAREPEAAPEIKALSEALAKEFPDPKQRIRALFFWFASGIGPWTGYPAYEEIVESLLFEYKTPELVAAIEGVTLSDTEKEGAARFFAGWTIDHWRPADNALIPAELKRSLLAHSLKSPDKDKRERALQAFGRGQ